MSGAVTPGGGNAQHTPPLGHRALTPLYDFAIASLTREKAWRKALVAAISPQPDDRILDIGSGTGSLALAIHQTCPGARYVGIDPDEEAVKRAINKTAKLKGQTDPTSAEGRHPVSLRVFFSRGGLFRRPANHHCEQPRLASGTAHGKAANHIGSE